MPDTLKFGIGRYGGEFVDEFKTKKTVDVAERKNRVGEIKKVYPHNTKTDVTISGGGVCPLALGVVADHGITGLDGGVFIVKEVEDTDKNTEFNEFSANATHYPNAEVGEAAVVGP